MWPLKGKSNLWKEKSNLWKVRGKTSERGARSYLRNLVCARVVRNHGIQICTQISTESRERTALLSFGSVQARARSSKIAKSHDPNRYKGWIVSDSRRWFRRSLARLWVAISQSPKTQNFYERPLGPFKAYSGAPLTYNFYIIFHIRRFSSLTKFILRLQNS